MHRYEIKMEQSHLIFISLTFPLNHHSYSIIRKILFLSLLTAGAHVPECRIRLRTVGDHGDEFCYNAFSITNCIDIVARLCTSPIDR